MEIDTKDLLKVKVPVVVAPKKKGPVSVSVIEFAFV